MALVFLWGCASIVADDVRYLRDSFQQLATYEERRQRWIAFTSVLAGHRILSTYPPITALSNTPEVPDPYLNAVLERAGKWNYAPVIAQLEAGQFELVVVNRGYPAREIEYRGVPFWSAGMRDALTATYTSGCAFEDLDVWLPARSSSTLLPRLVAVGCTRENGSDSLRGSSPDL